jgi:hypothetical protein
LLAPHHKSWHLIINPTRQDVPAGGRNICFRNPFMHCQFVMKAVNDVRLSRAPSMLTRNSPTLRVRKSQTVAFFRSDSFSEVKSTSMCLAVGFSVGKALETRKIVRLEHSCEGEHDRIGRAF